MTDQILEKLKAYSCFDVGYVEGLVLPMDPQIRPLSSASRMVGRAFTVNENNAICKNIFNEIGKDEVLVVRGGDPQQLGSLGFMICELIAQRGAVGAIIDGGAQDTPKIINLGFPVFSRFIVPTHGPIHLVGQTQVPIKCGGVQVNPGDIIMGDNDGVIVIPQRNEVEVLKQAELMREARDYVDTMTHKGVDLWDIPGVKEMWAEKEQSQDYHWRVYETWNEKYIPPEMRKVHPR
jgi:4-hydroxy-4-methyl-2-oxoglutarate aldolase